MYHTIEKCLAYTEFRAGFGKANLGKLISAMENYAKVYDVSAPFYETVGVRAFEKNSAFGYKDPILVARIRSLPGHPNDKGGIIHFDPLTAETAEKLNYKEMTEKRHSIRHFSMILMISMYLGKRYNWHSTHLPHATAGVENRYNHK